MVKILAVVAHPDDEVIGLGGTLIKHISVGDEVRVLFLADGKSSRDSFSENDLEISKKENKMVSSFIGYSYKRFDLRDNQLDKYPLLKIVTLIENEVDKSRPNVIYTHSFQDINIDHQICTLATITAVRPIDKFNFVSEILLFETLSETEWGPSKRFETFTPNLFVELSQEQLNKKLEAMSLYKSELREGFNPRTLAIIEANSRLWGAKYGIRYCEPFQVYRIKR